MLHFKHKKLSASNSSKVMLIILLDVLFTSIAFFLGLWFRYDFMFHEIADYHMAGYSNTILP